MTTKIECNCDCADPSAMQGLSKDCNCLCHKKKKHNHPVSSPPEPKNGYYPGEELMRIKQINKELLEAAKFASEVLLRPNVDRLDEAKEKLDIAIAKVEGK